MKKTIFKLVPIILIYTCITIQAKAQWLTTGTLNNIFAQPDNTGNVANWTRSVGIGYFNTPGTYPQSFLNINTFGMILPTNGSIPTFGNLFRTDGPDNVDNMWQLFTGPNATSLTEKARLFTTNNPPSNSNDFNIWAPLGALYFNSQSTHYNAMIDPERGYLGLGFVGNFNTVGTSPNLPLFPLHILGDGTFPVTTMSWHPGIYLENHAVIAFSADGNQNALFLGHPSNNPAGNFYCGLAPGIATNDPVNYVYRIIGDIGSGLVPPNVGDFEFISDTNNQKNVIVDGNIGVGVNTNVSQLWTPTNRVEINTTAPLTFPTTQNPSTITGANTLNGHGTATGFSGLRFTDLRASSTPYPSNPAPGFLSVDENGDVILVPEPSPGNFGSSCANSTWNIPIDWHIGIPQYNIYFEGQAVGRNNSNFGIGYHCRDQLAGKLSVSQTKTYGYDQYGNATTAIAGHFLSAPTFIGTPNQHINESYAVYGLSKGDNKAGYGVYGKAESYTISNSLYGIYGTASGLHGNSQVWAGYFNGKVFASGGYYPVSDSILKKNVVQVHNYLYKIDSLKPVSYVFDTAYAYANGLNLPYEKQYGFVAQDVEKIIPELVIEVTKPAEFDTAGNIVYPEMNLKALNYNAFFGILTEGVQELDSITNRLSEHIDSVQRVSDDYDFLLSGTNKTPKLPSDINAIKYTNGYLQLNHNSIYPSAVFDVRNDSSLANFIDTIGTAYFGSDMTGFNIPTNSTFSNVLCDVTNAPDTYAQIIGVNSHVYSQASNNRNAGVFGNIEGYSLWNSGVNGFAKDADFNYGVQGQALSGEYGAFAYGLYGEALGNGQNNGSFNIGIFGTGANGSVNFGGMLSASSSNTNYGAFALAWGGQQNYGIWAEAPQYTVPGASVAAYINGNLAGTGINLYASDAKFKQNISSLSNATTIINHLNPRSYNFNLTNYPYINLNPGNQFGFVAQELEQVLPDLVKQSIFRAEYDSTGHMIHDTVQYKSINYIGLIPIVVQAIKEINQKNDSLTHCLTGKIDSLKQIINNYENRFNNLELMINNCCHPSTKSMLNNNNNEVTEVELENIQAIVLDQNVPNPFAENTLINYFIPENINFAQIIFTDNYGRIMKTVDIKTSGKGMIKVYAANLSSGIYTYSLIVDGKVVDSKKMVCSKK
jgi:hypothetical protein